MYNRSFCRVQACDVNICWGFWRNRLNEHKWCLMNVVVRWDCLGFTFKIGFRSAKPAASIKMLWLIGVVLCSRSRVSAVCLPTRQQEILFALFTWNTFQQTRGTRGRGKRLDWFPHRPTKSASLDKLQNMEQSGWREVIQAQTNSVLFPTSTWHRCLRGRLLETWGNQQWWLFIAFLC